MPEPRPPRTVTPDGRNALRTDHRLPGNEPSEALHPEPTSNGIDRGVPAGGLGALQHARDGSKPKACARRAGDGRSAAQVLPDHRVSDRFYEEYNARYNLDCRIAI